MLSFTSLYTTSQEIGSDRHCTRCDESMTPRYQTTSGNPPNYVNLNQIVQQQARFQNEWAKILERKMEVADHNHAMIIWPTASVRSHSESWVISRRQCENGRK